MPTPRELSRGLRLRTDLDLRRRRWLVGLSVLGVAIGQVVTLYQTGILRRLPEPPVEPFNSERVSASGYAYKRLQALDAVLMMGTYAATAGGQHRAEQSPGASLLLALPEASRAVRALRR